MKAQINTKLNFYWLDNRLFTQGWHCWLNISFDKIYCIVNYQTVHAWMNTWKHKIFNSEGKVRANFYVAFCETEIKYFMSYVKEVCQSIGYIHVEQWFFIFLLLVLLWVIPLMTPIYKLLELRYTRQNLDTYSGSVCLVSYYYSIL